MRQSKNGWKRAFWILLLIDGIIVITLLGLYLSLVFPSTTSPIKQTPQVKTSGKPVFVVSGNKAELTGLLNEELKKELKGNLEASILLQKNVTLQGSIKLLNIKVPFKMIFEPKVSNGGEAVVLNETYMSIGDLPLPVGEVLQFIKKGTQFPKWVVVDPGKKRLVVHLSNFIIRDQFTIRAAKIDLPNNKLVFNIYKTANTTSKTTK